MSLGQCAEQLKDYYECFVAVSKEPHNIYSSIIMEDFSEAQIWEQIHLMNRHSAGILSDATAKVESLTMPEREHQTHSSQQIEISSQASELDVDSDSESSKVDSEDALSEIDDECGSLQASVHGEDNDDEGEFEEDDSDADEDNSIENDEEDLNETQLSMSDTQMSKKQIEEISIKPVSVLQSKLKALETEIDTLEDQQLKNKHWSFIGEASAKSRPFNSLLDADLELPFGHLASHGNIKSSEDLENDGFDDSVRNSSIDFEKLIKQRISDEMFDDVVFRKDERNVQENDQKKQLDNLDFKKSKEGLGDMYAKQYSSEIMGQAKDEEKRISRDKQELKDVFSKLMYKVDCLTNSSFKPRPPLVRREADGSMRDLQVIKIEEAIPITVANIERSVGAPQEGKMKVSKGLKEKSEVDRDERRTIWRANKKRRKAKDLGDIREGKKVKKSKIDEKNKI